MDTLSYTIILNNQTGKTSIILHLKKRERPFQRSRTGVTVVLGHKVCYHLMMWIFVTNATDSLLAPTRGPLESRRRWQHVRPYEAMFIFRPDLEEEAIKELVARFQEIVTSRGGEVTQVNEMGRRRLAYPIQHFREGYYVVLNFNSKPDASEELNRVMRITDSVIRHMIIRDDE